MCPRSDLATLARERRADAQSGSQAGNPIRVLLTRAKAPDVSYRDPPLALPVGGEDAAMVASQASGSNITSSSILPPEHAQSCSAQRQGQWQQDSGDFALQLVHVWLSEYRSRWQDKPLAPFATSVGAARRRSLHHSSSHGDLSTDLNQFSRSPNDTFGRSWGRFDASRHLRADLLERKLRRCISSHDRCRSMLAKGEVAVSDVISSSRHGGGSASQHSGGQSSFKVPASLRSKTASTRLGVKAETFRILAGLRVDRCQYKRSSMERARIPQARGQHTEGDKAARKEERRRLAKAMDPNATKKAVGAAMRLDRGRTAAPAVDPIEWIANVRLENDETDLDRNASEIMRATDDGKKQRYDDNVASGHAAGKAVRSAVGFGREGTVYRGRHELANPDSRCKVLVTRSSASTASCHGSSSRRWS